ncbi:hypothetical protein ACH5RR_033040 [Cinchona calisaya]|uniref:Uncharacterized protein n=1 Tax=Cinchona calisaya TaxID=153742 RepID=A0ABD2YJU9_9GENT
MPNISLLVLFLGVVVLATPSTSRLLYIKTEFNYAGIELLYFQAQTIVDTVVEETIKKQHVSSLPSKDCIDKAIKIHEEVKKYLEEALSPSKILDIHDEVKNYFNKVLEAVIQLHAQAQAIVTLDEETTKDNISPIPSSEWENKAIEVHEEIKKYLGEAVSSSGELDNYEEVKKYLDETLSPSGTFDNQDEVNNYFDRALEAIVELYAQARVIVDTLDEKTTNHHLSPLPSKEWAGKAIEIHEELKNYLNQAVSPSKTLDIDHEVKSYFDKVLPPLEIWDIDEKVENYHNFAVSSSEKREDKTIEVEHSGREGVVKTDKEVKDQHDNSPTNSKTPVIDEEAENYHRFALSPADRLEEKAAEIEIEVHT